MRLRAARLLLSLDLEATVSEAAGRSPPDAEGPLERLSPGTFSGSSSLFGISVMPFHYGMAWYVTVRHGTLVCHMPFAYCTIA